MRGWFSLSLFSAVALILTHVHMYCGTHNCNSRPNLGCDKIVRGLYESRADTTMVERKKITSIRSDSRLSGRGFRGRVRGPGVQPPQMPAPGVPTPRSDRAPSRDAARPNPDACRAYKVLLFPSTAAESNTHIYVYI